MISVLLYYHPRCSVTFWTHPEIIPVGQFFRRRIKSNNQSINQSSVDFHCESFAWLIDWLIDDKLTLTWLVYWIRTARCVFTGAGLKWPNTAGQYSICPALFTLNTEHLTELQSGASHTAERLHETFHIGVGEESALIQRGPFFPRRKRAKKRNEMWWRVE